MPEPLAMYLQTHIAASKVAEGVTRRLLARTDDDGEIEILHGFLKDVLEERSIVEGMMHAVRGDPALIVRGTDVAIDVLTTVGRAGSSVFSPGKAADLEALAVGVRGKISLWETVAMLAAVDARLDGRPFDELRAQAVAQERDLLRLRDAAVLPSFAPTAATS